MWNIKCNNKITQAILLLFSRLFSTTTNNSSILCMKWLINKNNLDIALNIKLSETLYISLLCIVAVVLFLSLTHSRLHKFLQNFLLHCQTTNFTVGCSFKAVDDASVEIFTFFIHSFIHLFSISWFIHF